jgi:hypothetical protein
MATRRTKKSARHIFENFYDGASDDAHALQVWAYTDRLSYQPGEQLELHVNTTAHSYSLEIYRDGLTPGERHVEEDLPGAHHATPDDCSITGCGWPVSWRFTIPDDWCTGVYLMVLRAHAGEQVVEYEHMFILRRPPTAQAAPIALVCATGTWVAYNDWGGANSYKGFEGPEADQFSPILSTQRPWARGFCKLPAGAPRTVPDKPLPAGTPARYPYKEWAYANGYSIKFASAGWATYERHFLHWAEANDFEVDVIALHDLHTQPELLARYRCAVFVGHDEYWSWEMRDAVDAFVENGGNAARFAGNFLWQIRMENDGKTQVCYKYIARVSDPVMGSDGERRATNTWEAPEVNRPGALTFGVNATRGVYASMGHCVPRGPGGFTMYRPEHWAFNDAYLSYGDVLGGDSRIFGYEVDGLDYTTANGLPFPVAAEAVPDGLSVLAMGLATNTEADFDLWGESLYIDDLDCAFLAETLHGEDTPQNRDKVTRGNGMIVHFKRGSGEVFTAGTCEWVIVLTRKDMQVEQVTRNVLTKFTTR